MIDNSSYEKEDVAIIGMGFRLPSGDINKSLSEPDEFWNKLKDKFNGIVDATTDHERWNENHFYANEVKTKNSGLVSINEWKNFDPLLFGISPAEAHSIDPQQRLLLKSTFEAIEDSGIDYNKLRGTNTSVYIGATTADYKLTAYTEKDNNINVLTGSNLHTMSNRISYSFDFRGQSLTLDTACSSSSNAIQLGYKSIINGDSEYSIVGGSNLILDTVYVKSVSYLNMAGKSGYCKAFDASADGFVRSEGCGIILLKKLSSAIRDGNRIYCIIKGATSNNDGTLAKSTFLAPSKLGQNNNLQKVLIESKINPSEIDYFECHGTGTPVGDPIEVEGITMTLLKYKSKDSPLLIGSVKSNIGHLEPASGIASVIKCCLMFKNRQFVPNIHFNNPNPAIKFDEWNVKVVTEVLPFPKDKAVVMGVNNFGATASNVCIILKEFQNNHHNISNHSSSNNNYLVPFSSNSKKSLESYQNKIIENIQDYSNSINFGDFIKYQIYCKSLNFLQRSVIQTSTSSISSNDWNKFKIDSGNKVSTSNNKSFNILHKHSNPVTVFVFCGQGPQYSNMAKQLYDSNVVFKKSMDLVNEKLSVHAGFNILERLRSIHSDDKLQINNPLIAQTSLFMVQVSLFELYKHWGISPSYLVGHSFGELTSTYCSGMISLDDACYFAYHRARLQSLTVTNDKDKSNNFRMLVINISKDQFNQLYSSKYPDIEFCCYNSPTSIVVGGKESQLEEILLDSKSNGIFSSFLGALTGFHSSAQDKIKDQVLSLNPSKYYNKPSIPTFSTVTGELFGQKELDNPLSNYIYLNIRESVEFSKAIDNLLKTVENQNQNNKVIFLELSPHPTLLYYIKQMIPKDSSFFNSEDSISVFSSLKRSKNDQDEINNTISQLYCKGYNVNFKCQFNSDQDSLNLSKIISNTSILPRYQWDDSQYWMESERAIKTRTQGPAIDQLGHLTNISSNSIVYETSIDINRGPFEYLKGHIVKDKFYFPGCGYICSIESIFKSKDFIITYLEFKTPLVLKEREAKHLQTSLFKTSRNEYRVSFNFKEKNEWVETSTGKIQLFNFSTPIEILNIESLKLKCNYTKLCKEELYTHIKSKTGLVYLNCFKRIEECYQGDKCTLSKLSLDQKIFNFKSPSSFLDPSILDSTLHGLLSYLEDPCQLVFDRVEDYRIYSSRIPASSSTSTENNSIWVYSEFLNKFGDSLTSNMKVMLSDGTVIIEADKVVCTSLIPIKNPLTIQNPNNELYSLYWQERDSLIQKSTLNNLSFNNINDYNDIVNTIIKNSISPIKDEKAIFTILQFISPEEEEEEINLSNSIINNINSILSLDGSSEIDIEFTICLKSNEEIQKVKSELSSNNFSGSLLFREVDLDLQQALIDDHKFKLNFYDIVILSNHIKSSSKLIKDNQLYKIINPKGLLVHNSTESNENLVNLGFEYNNFINNNNIIISQKPSIINNNISIPNYDKIIVFVNDQQEQQFQPEINNFINQIQLKYNSNHNNHHSNKRVKYTINNDKISVISNIEQFNSISSSLTSNSLIYFLKSINKEDQVTNITMEYIKIIQYLLKNKLSNKVIIVSRYALKETLNYLNSTVLGSRRYFEEFKELKLFTIDFDDESLKAENVIETIESLTSKYQHAEYLVRNNITYFERLKKEVNIKKRFKSSSYQDNNIDQQYAKLDSNLEYQLLSKPLLKVDHVEVKTEAVSINYKDYLIYSGLVPVELRNSEGNVHDPQFGFEFSGVVTAVGSNVKEFKIGDQVFGYSPESTSTFVYPHKEHIYFKPKNQTHVQTSSVPVVFMTSLYSLFNIGHLDIENKESVLIHTGAGGVGLSALNILKWKKHKGYLFVTVGSKEKEQYLKDNYGDFITGIYSTRNLNYSNEIKSKLRELGSKKDGVDLILNTLSNEYMDANFKTLCRSGRIVDISITHLNPHEYTDFNKFKYNIGYYAVEMSRLYNGPIKELLKELSKAFENQELELIPIKEYSVKDIKESIEFINERKLIGKIVVKMDQDIVNSIQQQNDGYSLLKSNYKINHSSLGKTVLVTGQTGLILEILKWISLYSTSVENIIVLSKSRKRWELEKLINSSKSRNQIKFIFKSCDISNYQSVKEAIDEIYNQEMICEPVESIFHFAFQYVNHEPLEINKENLELSYSAKAFGAVNLHLLSLEKKWNLKQFMLSSSISAIFGSPIQCGYTSSNYFLDALARHRRSLGLNATSTYWGLFESAGFISQQKTIAKFIQNLGYSSISVNLLLGSLDLFTQNQEISNSLAVNIFNDSIIDHYEHYPALGKIDFITNAIKSKNKLKSLSNEDSSASQKVIEKISELLSIEPTRLNTDVRLIDMGSDSLVIISLKNFIDKEFKQNLFTITQLQVSTIGIIIQNILKSLGNGHNNNKNNQQKNNNQKQNNSSSNSQKDNSNRVFWENEIKLDSSIKFNRSTNIKELLNGSQLLNIFLTGASGYLGGYLLADLLKRNNVAKVYCLIRNKKSNDEALKTILDNLKYHQLFEQLTNKQLKKIQVVLGDLSLDYFGLDIKEYKNLSFKVNLIISNGASTNLVSHYSECKLTNVDSTKEMIKFAGYNEKLIKPIIYISSFSVFLNVEREEYLDKSIATVDEFEKLGSSYAQSKIVSEYLLLEASKRGLPTMIIRLPFLFANPSTNIGNKNDFIQTFLGVCYRLNCVPSQINPLTIISPITFVSDNVCKLLFNSNCWTYSFNNNIVNYNTSHSGNNNNSTFNLIDNALKISDILAPLSKELNLKELSYDDWRFTLTQAKNSEYNKVLILDPSVNLYNEKLKPTNSTIELVESMNSNYNNSKVTTEMFKNYLLHNFKK